MSHLLKYGKVDVVSTLQYKVDCSFGPWYQTSSKLQKVIKMADKVRYIILVHSSEQRIVAN